MTTDTLTLTAFLLARIEEDEAAATRAGSFTPWTTDFQNDNYGHLTVQPSRIEAECAAKRAIVERCNEILRCFGWEYEDAPDLANDTLQALASVYADHDDYRAEWAL